MKKYYEHRLRKTDEDTYTVLPGWGLHKAIAYLVNHGIPYEVVSQYDFPRGVSNSYDFLGEHDVEYVFAIKAKVNADDLHEIAEETFNLEWSDLGEYVPKIEIHDIEITAKDLWDEGSSVEDCLATGFNVRECMEAGWTKEECIEALPRVEHDIRVLGKHDDAFVADWRRRVEVGLND